jgi:hypothetical protein
MLNKSGSFVEKVDSSDGKNRKPRDRFVAIAAGRPLQAMPSRGAGNVECGEGTRTVAPTQTILMGSVASVFSGKAKRHRLC